MQDTPYPVFRGVFPAASLKLVRALVGADGQRGFPRGIPRGLIEASASTARPVGTAAVFRGVFPAASLKLVVLDQDVLGQRRFPRGIPRGLIEAECW